MNLMKIDHVNIQGHSIMMATRNLDNVALQD